MGKPPKVFQVAPDGTTQKKQEAALISDDEREQGQGQGDSPRAYVDDDDEADQEGSAKPEGRSGRRDSTEGRKQPELKKALKHKEKRAAAEGQAFEDLLLAYQENPNPNVPPPVPPRDKKRAFYKLRKCL